MHNLAPLVISGLVIAFVIYRRARAHIGRQLLRPTRLKVRIAIFSAIAAVIVVLSHAPLLPVVVGAAAGAGLAALALKLTRFENEGSQVFYTPNIYIGLNVTFLFIARMVARFSTQMDAISAAQAGQVPRPNLATSMGTPTTAGIFLLLIGYYVVYYAGILWTAGKTAEPPEPRRQTRPPDAAPGDGSTLVR